MVFHIIFVRQVIGAGIVCGARALVVLHARRHLCPGVQFEYLTQRERRLRNGSYGVQQRGIHLVLVPQGHRQVVVVVADLGRIDDGGLISHAVGYNRRSHQGRLDRRILLVVVIICCFVMEDGIATHSNEFLTLAIIGFIYPHRVTDDTEREVVGAASSGTGVSRLHTPALIRYIRVAYSSVALAEPTPPAEEVAVANGQLYILVGVVVEGAYVLMYLLHTVGSERISRGTRRVNQVLVVGILEQTGLGYRQTLADEAHLVFNHYDIDDVDSRLTRRTDTALGTLYRYGGGALVGYAAPCRRITEVVHQSYLGHSRVAQIHEAGFRHVFCVCIQHLYSRVRDVQHVMTGVQLRSEFEGTRYRSGDCLGEGMVVFVVTDNAHDRVISIYVVGLAYQRYLQLGIVHRPELAPIALETIRRRIALQREGHMQRIDDIDVLAAYFHIRRTGWSSRGGNGGSSRQGVLRMTDAALGLRTAVKVTRIWNKGDGLTGFPFQATARQVGHVGLLLAAAIGQLVAHQHRVFFVCLVARLDSHRHVGVIAECDRIATGVGAIVEQAVLLIQIAPREDGGICFVVHQPQLGSATACQGELQPFVGTVLQFYQFLFVGIFVGNDIHVVISQQRRFGWMNTGRLAVDFEIAVYAIFRLERQLNRVGRIIIEAPRCNIRLVAVGGIERTLDERCIGCSLFVERRVLQRILAEDQSAGTRHDIIALVAALYRPNQFVAYQRGLYQRDTYRYRIRNVIDGHGR